MGDLRFLPGGEPLIDGETVDGLSEEQEGEARRISATVLECGVRGAMRRAGLSYDQADIVAEGVTRGARAAVRFEKALHDGP